VSRRITYSDEFTGAADRGIRRLLEDDDDEESGIRKRKIKKILLNVINNELTPRQKEIVMLYYFKEMDIVAIGKQLGVTPQAVSAAMKRARLKLLRFMQYYL
jgi:RNA polymerase sigma-70 factor (ECF subfamily)